MNVDADYTHKTGVGNVCRYKLAAAGKGSFRKTAFNYLEFCLVFHMYSLNIILSKVLRAREKTRRGKINIYKVYTIFAKKQDDVDKRSK